ncbi:hypothetical protein C1G86_1573 [Dehalococcoides mccartyi]|uniref:Uncharacterized protein n=1 Tax=Dehalococcoides mccartyi TaxID=61435 RepID=A0A328EQ06_9CHLR|nr:hypothetical protein C1G87_1607 [Dehalococcoides mccartyi]RAL70046.1 hypothetical protein C1G86_1573 [Dehalococcoides mccartyi]
MEQGEPENKITEVILTKLEATPAVLLQAGISVDHGHYSVSLLIDTSERPDIKAVFEGHLKQQEGECSTIWGGPPNDLTASWILLVFKKPVTTKVLFEFDVLRHGPLLDRLVDGRHVVLAQGIRGENLDTALQDGRGVLNIEVAPPKDWDGIWQKAIISRTGLSPEEAASVIEATRAEMIVRVQNPSIPPFDELAGVFLDDKEKRMIFTSNRMLINQLHRDGPAVAASFDEHLWSEIEALSPEYSRITSYANFGTLKATREGNNVCLLAGQLIGNALNNIAAATELIRLGYRLQPSVLLRPAIEWISMAGYLFIYPDTLGQFKAGKIKSTDIMTTVGKEINPVIPKAWGFLSNDFVHVGNLHQRIQLPEKYESAEDAAAKTNLLGIHVTLMIASIVAELVFFDVAKPHEYWREVKPGHFEFLTESPVWQRLEEIASRLSIEVEQPPQTT